MRALTPELSRDAQRPSGVVHDTAASEAAKRSFRDLQDRDAGLREELRSVEREWAVWQVQHGLRKQQDAELVYQRNAADC